MATLKQNSEALKAITTKLKNLPKRAVLTDLVVTKNGEYASEDENSGFKRVSVNVPSDIDAFIDRSIKEISSNGVTHISDYALYFFSTLTRAEFPNATSIGNNAFHTCQSLTSLNFPNAKSIGRYAFSNCYKLKSISIPKATGVPNSSCGGCNALVSADFSSATYIDSKALQYCYSLKTVILRSEKMCSLTNTNALDSCYHIHGTVNSTYNPNGAKDGYFYVPRALLSDDDATKDYRRATNWSTYASQFRALEDYTVDGTITGELDPNKI